MNKVSKEFENFKYGDLENIKTGKMKAMIISKKDLNNLKKEIKMNKIIREQNRKQVRNTFLFQFEILSLNLKIILCEIGGTIFNEFKDSSKVSQRRIKLLNKYPEELFK